MSRRKRMDLSLYPEDSARRVAAIIGPHSAAALALGELASRRASGEAVSLFRATGGYLVVGPSPDHAPVSQGSESDGGRG